MVNDVVGLEVRQEKDQREGRHQASEKGMELQGGVMKKGSPNPTN